MNKKRNNINRSNVLTIALMSLWFFSSQMTGSEPSRQ